MSSLHPILARKGRFAPILSTTIPLAALLTALLARPGAFRFGEAISLAWPLALTGLFLFLSVWYVARAAPLRGDKILQTVVTHGVAAVLIIGQLGKLLGLSIEARDPLSQLWEALGSSGASAA